MLVNNNNNKAFCLLVTGMISHFFLLACLLLQNFTIYTQNVITCNVTLTTKKMSTQL